SARSATVSASTRPSTACGFSNSVWIPGRPPAPASQSKSSSASPRSKLPLPSNSTSPTPSSGLSATCPRASTRSSAHEATHRSMSHLPAPHVWPLLSFTALPPPMHAPLKSCAITPVTSPPRSSSSVAVAATTSSAASPHSAPAFPSAAEPPRARPSATSPCSSPLSKELRPQTPTPSPPRSPPGPPLCFTPPSLHLLRPHPLLYATPRTPEGCRSHYASAGHAPARAPRTSWHAVKRSAFLLDLQHRMAARLRPRARRPRRQRAGPSTLPRPRSHRGCRVRRHLAGVRPTRVARLLALPPRRRAQHAHDLLRSATRGRPAPRQQQAL